MAEIKIRDYEDEWSYNVIGCGNNSSGYILPIIDKAIEDKESEITVYLNSCGGSVWCSLAITNGLKRAKENGIKIITINEGICASAATQIFMAGDERIVYTSLFMIHKPSIFAFGQMDEDWMRRESEALRIHQDTILLTYAPSGLDDATLTEMINATTWLTPALCLSLGFATEDRSAPDQKAEIPEPAMDIINKSSATNRVYAHKFFNTITLKTNNMDVQETLRKNTEAMNKSVTVMDQIGKFFTNLLSPKNEDDTAPSNVSSELADGTFLYHDGELAVGTEVFTDEGMTEHPTAGNHELANGDTVSTDDGGLVTQIEKKVEETEDDTENSADLEALKAENLALTTALNNATTTIETQNEALTKLKNIKSNFTPEKRNQEINGKRNSGAADNSKPDLSKEAREARRKELQETKNSKKTN